MPSRWAATAWWYSWTSSWRNVRYRWTRVASAEWTHSTSHCYWWPVTKHTKNIYYRYIIATFDTTVVPLLKDALWRRHPSRKDTNSCPEGLWIHVMLPLTKGHLSNKDRIVWQKGVSLLEGDYCTGIFTVKLYHKKLKDHFRIGRKIIFICIYWFPTWYHFTSICG